jgi:hypothetical protein
VKKKSQLCVSTRTCEDALCISRQRFKASAAGAGFSTKDYAALIFSHFLIKQKVQKENN